MTSELQGGELSTHLKKCGGYKELKLHDKETED